MHCLNDLHRSVQDATSREDTPALPNMLDTSEAARRIVYSGVLPWNTGPTGANGLVGTQRHFGLLYRTARHKLARTEEEELLLRKEVVLMHNWLEERLAEVAKKLEGHALLLAERTTQCAAAAAAPSTSQAAHETMLVHAAQKSKIAGRLVLLAQEQERLRCIQADARRRVPLHPPAPAGVAPGGEARSAQG